MSPCGWWSVHGFWIELNSSENWAGWWGRGKRLSKQTRRMIRLIAQWIELPTQTAELYGSTSAAAAVHSPCSSAHRLAYRWWRCTVEMRINSFRANHYRNDDSNNLFVVAVSPPPLCKYPCEVDGHYQSLINGFLVLKRTKHSIAARNASLIFRSSINPPDRRIIQIIPGYGTRTITVWDRGSEKTGTGFLFGIERKTCRTVLTLFGCNLFWR